MPAPLPLDRTHIKPGDRPCAAISGGADSVALLLTLHAANTTKRDSLGIGLSAVHVHHGLRGEEADAAPPTTPPPPPHAAVPTRIATTSEGLEEAARTLRYDVFSQLLAANHAD